MQVDKRDILRQFSIQKIIHKELVNANAELLIDREITKAQEDAYNKNKGYVAKIKNEVKRWCVKCDLPLDLPAIQPILGGPSQQAAAQDSDDEEGEEGEEGEARGLKSYIELDKKCIESLQILIASFIQKNDPNSRKKEFVTIAKMFALSDSWRQVAEKHSAQAKPNMFQSGNVR